MDKTANEANSVELGTSEETQESNDSTEALNDGETSDGDTSTSEKEAPSEPQWLVPGRFKTADDVLRSYQNLEAQYSRTQNEIHNLKQATQAKRDPVAENEAFLKELKENPVEAIRKYSGVDQPMQEVKRMAFQSEHAKLMQNEEYRNLDPVMAQIADQYRDLISPEMQNDPKLLHILYWAAKGASMQAQTAEAEKKGVQKGEANALQKKKAQFEGSSGSKGKVTKAFDINLPLEEMRKQLGEKKI